MQFKFTSVLLLAAAVIAPVFAAPRANPNPSPMAIQDELNGLGESLDKITKDIADWFKDVKLPSVENIDFTIPDEVSKFFQDAEDKLKDAPDAFWKEIKENRYPEEVQNWINSLPSEKEREEARKDLQEWAVKYENDGNAAVSLNGNVRVAVLSAAGVLAVALVL